MNKMKTFLLVALALSTTHCTMAYEMVCDFGKSPVAVSERFVNQFDNIADLAVHPLEVYSEHLKGDIDISLYKYEEFKNDPGDFQVVSISTEGKQYTFRNDEGWVCSDLFMNNGEFYMCEVDDFGYLLFFIGYSYASDPGFLTLVAVVDNKAFMVFNQKYRVVEVTQEPFSMVLEDRFAEYVFDESGNTRQVTFPKTYRLFLEDGVLKLAEKK